jgi:hypothetical protein
MKLLTLIVCLLAGTQLTGCNSESIYPKVKYSTTLQNVEVISTDLRLPPEHPARETIETLDAGLLCVDPATHNILTEAALSCEKELKKLRRTCKTN